MKKLVRIKLINWHRFTNSTIEIGDNVLLSGENGAGKSTLLDAIQFVITSSAASFNKAAHENGKRKLTGYIRCKTGRENRPYERTGAVSAHIALEFYEESKKRHFIIGAVVDSASEGQETTVRYLIDDASIDDSMFIRGDEILSISGFRAANGNIRQWCKTQAEAKKMIKSRLGRIEDKFFTLIPKALAFKPIDDIKDFVYSYVLDEKEVNIEVLRENVRTYQDLERTLKSVRTRIGRLELIDSAHSEVVDCMKKDELYEFFIAKADLDITEGSIAAAGRELTHVKYRRNAESERLDGISAEREQKQEMETSLRVELRENKDFIALEQQKRQLRDLEAEETVLSEERNAFVKNTTDFVRGIRKIQNNRINDDFGTLIQECINTFENPQKIENTADAKMLLESMIKQKQQCSAELQREKAELDIKLSREAAREKEITETLRQLKRNMRTYPQAVERLRQEIEKEFSRLGRDTSPHILCEVIDIADESWRNAVEGYLNTQRFHIIVEPESFDIALGVYDKLRRKKLAYGAGLINTAKLDAYEHAPEESLATVVTSQNTYAGQYINMILGKVHMCSRYDELKRYPTSITRECMKYQNRVASAIKPEIFRTPFIGKRAVKVQIELAEEELGAVKERMESIRDEIRKCGVSLKLMNTESETEVKYRIDVLAKWRRNEEEIRKCRSNIETLNKNSTIMQKQIQLDELEKIRHELERQINALNQSLGRIDERIDSLSRQQEMLTEQAERYRGRVREILDKYSENDSGRPELRIAEYEKQLSGKTPEKFKENYERRRKANETTRLNAERRMTELMAEYKTEHDFGAPASMEGFSEFAAVYERLKTSELLEYEEKVSSARAAAEAEFREQFLSKLQENMKQAQAEFKELNKALRDITFSSERYEFIHMKSSRYRSYYDMIMDDFNIAQGESLFSGIFHEAHKDVIDELFDRLALDRENSAAALAELTDYRTYMDYDIKIHHSDGEFSYYSKVCEEKSGGETQTPFYVTVAASFVQLYGSSIGGEAAGLVMFDEAFNNMDDERIAGVLEFLGRLPLQIIIAAPPDKIQYIGPSMDEVLLVMTDEKTCFVEEYHHDAI